MKHLLAAITCLVTRLAFAQDFVPLSVHPRIYLTQRATYLGRDRDTINRADPIGSDLIKVDSGQFVVVSADYDAHWALVSNCLASPQGPTAQPVLISPTDSPLTTFFVWRASLALVPYEQPVKRHHK